MAAHRKPAAEKAVTITVSISANLLDLLEQAAERNAMSRSEYIRESIKMRLVANNIKDPREVSTHAD